MKLFFRNVMFPLRGDKNVRELRNIESVEKVGQTKRAIEYAIACGVIVAKDLIAHSGVPPAFLFRRTKRTFCHIFARHHHSSWPYPRPRTSLSVVRSFGVQGVKPTPCKNYLSSMGTEHQAKK